MRKRWHLTPKEHVFRKLWKIFDTLTIDWLAVLFEERVPVWRVFLDRPFVSDYAKSFLRAVCRGEGDEFINGDPNLLRTKKEIFATR